MDDFCSKFLAFEEEHELLLQEVDGFHFWAFSRFNIYYEISRMISGGTATHNPDEKRVSAYLDIVRNMTLNNPILHASKKEIAFFTHARRVFLDDKYECIYTDKVAEEFGDRAVQCEFLYRNTHLKPAYSKNLLPLDYVDIWTGIQCRLNPGKYSEQQAVLGQKAAEIRQLVRDAFGVELKEAFLHNCFVRAFARYKVKKQLLGRLLDKINPKVVVEVVGYTFNNMILNEAALERGIVTVELQHGVIGRGHIAYNYQADRRYSFLPQNIFFFSDYWKQTCRFPLEDGNKHVVGYPYMESQMMKYKKTQPEEGKVRIIILSQPGIDDVFAELATKLLAREKLGNLDLEIIFKLHPHSYNGDKSIYAELLKDPRFKLIDHAKTPLYQLFAESDVQIGSTSTAIFEGVSYDLKTFIYHSPSTDVYMGDMCRLGYAQTFENDAELVEKIQRAVDGSGVASEKKVFFEVDAKRKMVNKLEELLKACN